MKEIIDRYHRLKKEKERKQNKKVYEDMQKIVDANEKLVKGLKNAKG